jgi:hypothetical protein
MRVSDDRVKKVMM